MRTSPKPEAGTREVPPRPEEGRRAILRHGGPGRLPRTLFLAALAGFGLAAAERVALAATGKPPPAAAPAAARCPEDTSLESLLPPGHPPVPGLRGMAAPRLPPGHPPVNLAPATPMFPQDGARTL